MMVCSVFTTLLGFSLCSAIQSMNNVACDSEPDTKRIQVGGNVSVPCLYLPGKIFNFHIYKGKEEIAAYTHENNPSNLQESSESVKKNLQFHTNPKDQLFLFILSGVTAEDTGLYRCKTNVIFPPPLIVANNASRILVLVEDHQCKCKDIQGGIGQESHHNPNRIWVRELVGGFFLGIYGIIVSIIAVVLWVKLRRANSSESSEYHNTKPITKGHGKKRGLQHPVPRYF